MRFLLIFGALPMLSYASSDILRSMIERAKEDNFEIKQQRNNLQISKIDSRISWRDLYLPKLSLSISAFDQDSYDGPLTDAQVEDRNDPYYRSRVTLSYNLFNGFKDYYGHQKNLATYNRSTGYLNREVREKVYKIQDNYLNLSLELNRLKLYQEDLRRDKELLNAAKIRYRKGHISKSDLNRSEISHLQTQRELMLQERNIQGIKTSLLNYMGSDGKRDNRKLLARIKPFTMISFEQEVKLFLQKIEKEGGSIAAKNFYRKYLKSSPDLIVLQRSQDIAELSKQVDRADFFPQLGLVAYHEYSDYLKSAAYERESDKYVLGVTLTIPLFDSFDTKFQDYKNIRLKNNATLAMKQHQFETKKELETLCENILKSFKAHSFLKRQYLLRQKIYNATFKRFKLGAITIKNLLDDKQDLQKDGQELASLSNNIRKTKLEIEKITGISW